MKSRIVYLDLLKFISIIAVILTHLVTDSYWTQSISSPFDEGMVRIVNTLMRFAVPVFMMTTGALLDNPEKRLTYGAILKKYVLKIGLVYIAWDLIYAIGATFAKNDNFFKHFMQGHYHMWYLQALFLIYLALPILRKIIASKYQKHCIYAFILLNFCSIIANVTQTAWVQDIFSGLHILEWISLPAYFIIGHYLHKNKISGAMYGLISLFALATLGVYLFVGKNLPYDFYVPFLAMTLFLSAKNFCSKFCKRLPDAILNIAKNTLGIYLAHILVLDVVILVLRKGSPNYNFPLPPVVTLPLITVAVLLISHFGTLLLKKIPRVGKYLA